MTLREFHNALRILLNIDRHEMVAANLLRHGDHNAWGEFRRDPYRWFIRASDQDAQTLWRIVEKRRGPRTVDATSRAKLVSGNGPGPHEPTGSAGKISDTGAG